ncbi:hypothetical protein ADUPG1_010222, partial [Aduncisulcus paluster]
IN